MMGLIRISESDGWVVDYDKERGMYRVSIFDDNHFLDEFWFDAYEDKEVDDRIEKIIEKLEDNKISFKKNQLSKGRIKMCLDPKGIETYLNCLINWIKGLK